MFAEKLRVKVAVFPSISRGYGDLGLTPTDGLESSEIVYSNVGSADGFQVKVHDILNISQLTLK